MAREKKAQIIDELQDRFSRSSIVILTDHRGLSTAEINALRRKLREARIEYRVVKNTLARFAVERTGRADLGGLFKGQVAVVLGYGNVVEPAKILTDYIRTSKSALAIKAGFLGTRGLTAKDVQTLATLPPREVLIARVLGGMQSPIANIIGVLAAPLRGFAGILQARIKQLEEG